MTIDQLLGQMRTEQQRTNVLLTQLCEALQHFSNRTHELVSLEVAAKSLGVSRHTVWRRVRSGEWPSYRVGRQFRVRLEAIVPLIEQKPGSHSNSAPSAEGLHATASADGEAA